jgi:uncharacterized membrane protein (UPF0127 family)
LLVVLAACADGGQPDGVAAPDTTAVTPVGFELVAATVTDADGTVCELCLWEAATPEQRQTGLMGVTDLGGADGMVFVYDAARTNRFWMRATPLPLDIAWFDDAGRFVSSATMTPCLSGPEADCARYGATTAYTAAIEVPAGRLAQLGIGPGSVLTLGAGCV